MDCNKEKDLFVGAGESGKTTVLKQMKLINASGFDASERENYRMIVFSNIITNMQTLLEIVDQLKIPLELETSKVRSVRSKQQFVLIFVLLCYVERRKLHPIRRPGISQRPALPTALFRAIETAMVGSRNSESLYTRKRLCIA